jgi:hypothetical protein
MSRSFRSGCVLLAGLLAALLLPACGQETVAPAVDVTGRWVGPVDSTTGPPSYDPSFGRYQLTLILTQSGSGVTGTFQSDISLSGTVSGGGSGRTVQLVMQFAPCGGSPGSGPGIENLRGDVDGSGQAMAISAQGSPCGSADYLSGTLTRQ